jgi:DNA-binding transcriptional ArsR family regulator
VEAYDSVFDALGDGSRRRIVELLRSGPQTVGQLADELPISRPAVSQHLRVLKGAGLVSERRLGTRRLYRVETETLGELRAHLDRLWSDALASFEAAAAQEAAAAVDP